ncbi:ras-related protein rab-4a [Anaeramoeba flamelloides]|uniref:Ras-related protein rab-4a n=1 Tax=Anaeramoeba flamelloides TaxID=1746091 RepID=A0AAV7YW42_9EUKA|nr:ras-related protein rab-4a [Anaeramoeba flamelloides]KAJ6248251.1 ras-related protein rab-4a [Anaeramoeba flamelloides]
MSTYTMIFKYIVVGGMGTGKTSLLNRFIDDEFYTDCPHTIGIEFAAKVVPVSDERIKVQVWDTAGQERFRAITRSYFRGAVCTLLVYDVSRRKSFNQLTTWLNDAQNLTNPNSLILLIGNKIDLEERVVTREEAEEFAQENNLLYTETSAKTGENVNDAFMDMTKKVYKLVKEGKLKLTTTETINETDLQSDNKPKKDSGGCC